MPASPPASRRLLPALLCLASAPLLASATRESTVPQASLAREWAPQASLAQERQGQSGTPPKGAAQEAAVVDAEPKANAMAKKDSDWVVAVSDIAVMCVPVLFIGCLVLFNAMRDVKPLPAVPLVKPHHVRTPGLKKNALNEMLNIMKHPMYKYQDDHGSFTATSHLVSYNMEKATGFRAVFNVAGTHFADSSIWWVCSVYLGITAVFTTLAALEIDKAIGLDLRSKLTIDSLRKITQDTSTVVSFLLGGCVSMLVMRWWNVRHDCIGGLWGAVDDLCLTLAAHMPHAEDRPAKETILRLALLSLRLCFNQIADKNGEQDLQEHVDAGIMTSEEHAILKEVISKPQVVWVWIMMMIHALADKGKIRNKEMTLPRLEQLCIQARGSIGETFAYTDTQIPYPYVHLLTMMVIITNVFLAVKCGLQIGGHLARIHGHFNALFILAEVCHITVTPFFQHSLIKLGCELSNPIGKHFFDLPLQTYHVIMRDENISFMHGGEAAPAYIKDLDKLACDRTAALHDPGSLKPNSSS